MAYIGKSPTGTGVRQRYYFTATGGETSLSGADDNSNTLVFSDGNYVDVSLNGIALVAGTDYNTSTANTIAGLSALSVSDIVEVVVYDIFTVADTVSAKDGGTFSGNVAMGGTLSVTGTSTLTGAATATGGLNVGTIKEATGTTTAMTIDSSGRILTPARPAFRVKFDSDTSPINISSITILDFNTYGSVDFDIGSNFVLASNKFVAPISGLYQIDSQVVIQSAEASTGVYIYVNINGTDTRAGEINDPQGGGYASTRYSGLFNLTANDEILIRVRTISDTSVTIRGDGTEFSGFLVG